MQILTASWVVPVSQPPLAHGRVAVSDGRIVWVGRSGDPGEPAGAVQDLGTGVLMPGLVNAHCHLELSHLAGAVERGRGFAAWVESLVERRAASDERAARAGIRRGISQLESTGTVAVGDVSNAMSHLDLLEASTLEAVVFYELLGWDPQKAAAILNAADRVATLSSQARMRMRTRVRLAAHAPYSVSPALLRGLVEREGPASIHLAESPDETRFLRSGQGKLPAFLRRRGLGHVAFTPPGKSPVQYLDEAGALRPGVLAVHCVQVDEADRVTLASRGVRVAICPRSNAVLDVGTADVPALLRSGIRLCLGTDSLASVDTLDLMADMAALQRSFPALSPELIVRMATAGGAEALQLPDLGTLEPGRRAALAFVPAEEAVSDPLALLTSGSVQARPVAP